MEIETIKKGQKLLSELQSIEHKIKELNKTESVYYITVCNTQSGANQYTYDISFNEDKDFMKTIKSMIIEKYKRMVIELENRIKEL